MDAVGQFKEQGYAMKLKAQITPDTIPSSEKELLAFLYNMVISI